ncbi:depupylase/deamidase Dop [Propionibacteriaceae bacterium Y1685]
MAGRADMVFGIETEYGISMDGGDPQFELHPMHLSNVVVRGYAELVQRARSGWDYATESPLRDVRGHEVARAAAHPDQLTDLDQGMANVVLTNGARFYVDHAHPEYSGPEVTTARDAVIWDRAGDEVLAMAAQEASRSLGTRVRIHKNNTDGKGVSYGTHENYLLSRDTPFDRVVTKFTGHLVSRQVITGQGRVGIGPSGERAGYQLTQRADFFEAEVGLETTINRPIINTRDEPHADVRRHRRLHVITGDANLSEYATWLKVGCAALVLRALQSGHLSRVPRLADPVAAMQQVSHDPTCRTLINTSAGDRITAIDLQEQYQTACARFVDEHPDFGSEAQYAEARELLTAWAGVLDQLRTDPMQLADRLDWVAKLKLINSYRQRDGLDWEAPKLALLDLQYGDVDPAKGLHAKLETAGRIRRLSTPEQVARARTVPPADTRAWFRGEVVRRFADQLVAASWDSIVLDVPGRRHYQRLEVLNPLGATRGELEATMAELESAKQLVELWERS